MGIEIGDDRAGFGPEFAAESVRIGFEREKVSVRSEDFVFVHGAFGDFRNEKFPDAGRAARTHGMDAAVPAVHVADDADALCGGSPDGKVRAGDACDGMEMRAKFFVGGEVAAFADEVKIEVSEEKREGVGIENFERLISVTAALNFVATGFGSGGLIRWPDGFEEAFGAEFHGIGYFCGRDGGIFENDTGFLGPGNEEADSPAFGNRMRAEDVERIGVCCGEQGIGADVEIGERFCGCGGSRRSARLGLFLGHGAIVRQEGWERKRGMPVQECTDIRVQVDQNAELNQVWVVRMARNLVV